MNLSPALRLPALLVRLRDKTRDRRSIFHMAAVVLKTNACIQVLMVAGSILLIRHVSKDEYGLWRVISSSIAFIQLMFGGLDQAIYRFVAVESRRNADAVALSAFAFKGAMTVLGIGVLIALYPWLPDMLNVPADLRPQFVGLFWLAAASTLLTPLTSTLYAVAGAHKQVDLIFNVSVGKQAAVFLCVLVIVQGRLGLVHYAACELALSAVQVAVLWPAARALAAERGGDLWAALTSSGRWQLVREGWQAYLRRYAMPLNVASALSYLRGHVPVILLGSQFSLQSAAIYSIFKNLLTTIHKTEGGIVAGVMPRVFEMYETNRASFLRKFHRWTMLIYAGRFATGAAIVAGSPFLFWLYKIDESTYLTLVLAILVLEFAMSEVVNISNMVVMMSKQTTTLMISAGVRFVFEIFLLWFVTRQYGMLGAAITLFLARSAETFWTVRSADRVFRMRQQYAIYFSLVCVFISLLATMWMLGGASFLQPATP